MKKTALFLAALMLLGGVSCSKSDSSSEGETPPEQSITETTTTTAVTTAAPETTTTEPPKELPEMDGPLKVLKCLDVPGTATIVVTGGRYAAVQCTDVGENEKSLVSIYLVDTVEDKLLRSYLSDEVKFSEYMLGVREDGTVVTSDFADEQLKFYPMDGDSYTMEYPEETIGVVLGSDGVLYSFYKDIGKISDTGEKTTIFHREDVSTLYFADFDKSIAAASLLSESLEHSEEFCMISLDSDEVLYTLEEPDDAQLYASKDRVICCRTLPDERGSSAYSVYDLDTGRLLKVFVDDSVDNTYTFSYGSGFGLTYNMKDEDKPFALKLLDLSDGSTALLDPEIDDACWCVNSSYGDTGLFVSAVNCMPYNGADKDTHVRLAVIDPEQAEYTGSLKEGEAYTYPAEPHHLISEKLGEARSYADSLEEKYGVKIMVGDEVLDLQDAQLTNTLVSTEKDFYPYKLDELLDALSTLDDTLSVYPEGFFDKFKKERGGGLIIGITDGLENAMGGHFTAAGITFSYGLWDIICINAYDINVQPDAVHHELWHAAEQRISLDTPLSEEKWLKLCPEGFEYAVDFDAYSDGLVSVDDTLLNSDDPYFISDYSKVTPMEDRATLIEELFINRVNDSSFFGDLKNYPHLQAKYDFLSEWSEKFFGYVYWEKIPDIAEHRDAAA